MSMRSDLGKVRGLGAAHDGTKHFWMQRLTAISNLPLVIFLICFIVADVGGTRADIVASIRNPWIALPLAMGVVSICWHMKLGLQMVIEDYVHTPALKIASLLLVTFYSFGLAALAIYAILKMNFGV